MFPVQLTIKFAISLVGIIKNNMRGHNIKIESVIRKTIIIINGEECSTKEENLTEYIVDHHTLNDLCFSDNEEILHHLGAT